MELKKIQLAIIGIGGRTCGFLKTLMAVDGVTVSAFCDIIPERMKSGTKILEELGCTRPDFYTDYRDVLKRADIDGVIISTSWNEHIKIAIACMEAGIPVSFEVGGASSLEQCWDLARCYERTLVPCMMLENCCFGRYELAVLNMIRNGIFGEIVHCDGGYRHNLGIYLGDGIKSGHQRSFHHLYRNAELYPTHEIGPIAKYLDINNGNRFLTLTATASKSSGLNEAYEKKLAEDSSIYRMCALGDIVTTVIKCARGETITIVHDTSLPRPYSRGNAVHGTKGVWSEDNNKGVYIEGVSPDEKWESMEEKYLSTYEHPIWKEYLASDIEGSHGGMDYMVLSAFVYCLREKKPFPIDVYDSVAWMAVTCLSEQSISMGSMPVPFPDFTNGNWIIPQNPAQHKYSL